MDFGSEQYPTEKLLGGKKKHFLEFFVFFFGDFVSGAFLNFFFKVTKIL